MNARAKRWLAVASLFAWVLVAAAAAHAAPIIPEPRESLVSNNAIVRQSDGKVILLRPSGELLISRDPRPITLADFAEPVRLFGEGGELLDQRPDSAALVAGKDAVSVVSAAGNTMRRHSTAAGGVSADASWQEVSTELPGAARIDDIVSDSQGNVHAICVIQGESETSPRQLAVVSFEQGKAIVRKVAESNEPISGARAAADGNDLALAWIQSDVSPRAVHARLDVASGSVSGLETIGPGVHVDVAVAGGQVHTVVQQSDGSFLAMWRDRDGGNSNTATLTGRAGHTPTLAVDPHGIVWLFAVGRDQRGMYYRRFMTDQFSEESECFGAPGLWKLSLNFSVQPAIGSADEGFAVLGGEYLGDFTEYRYPFHSIPVPRYSVNDQRRILFLDLLEVADVHDVQQQVGTAVKSDSNPLNLNGPPGSWDSGVAGYATVLHDEGKFRMWYNGESDAPGRDWFICYAESEDGIRWTKPNLGLFELNGSKDNNLLFPSDVVTSTPLIIKDEAETDPAKRYKMVLESSYEGSTSVYLSESPDGIRWTWPPHTLWGKSTSRNKTIRGFHPWHEPLSSFFRDPIATHPDYLWKIYGQDIYAAHPHFDPNRPRNLCVVHGPTPYDFVGYPSNPVLDPRTGVNDDQIHGGMVQPYQGVYVSLYQHWWGEDWLVDLRLAVSRDGVHFSRVQPQSPVLPLGAAGTWDSGMICTPNAVFERDGKLWLYYRGSIGTLATGKVLTKHVESHKLSDPWRMMTGLSRLRVDGFAYLTLGKMQYLPQPPRFIEIPNYHVPLEGRVTTIPIDADGIGQRSLHVNVDNHAPGFAWVRAQLRDVETGKVIDGFSFEDCDKIAADSLDHTVTWKGSPDLSKVQAKQVRVEFQLYGALSSPQLYSFWFAPAP